MRNERRSVRLGFRDLTASEGDHIAYFWEFPDEFSEAVSFLVEGLRQGDHLVVFGHEDANAAVCDVLDRRGSDCEALQSEDRLSVLGAETSGDLMLSRIGETFEKAIQDGAAMIRLLGNIGWGKPGWPDEEDILRFEAKVTGAAAAFPCVVICMYDANALSGSIVLNGAFGTHPLTIHGNLIRENPVCVPVEEYIERLATRRHHQA